MIDDSLNDFNDFAFLMSYLETLEYESVKKEFILLKQSIELMEKENEGLDRAIKKSQVFEDSVGIQRKIESGNRIESGVETKIFKAVISGVLTTSGELFYSMRRHYDKKGNSITEFSDKNISFKYLNDTLILISVWFDEKMGVSIHDGGLFLNELKEYTEDRVNTKDWYVNYLRITEDALRLSIEKKYRVLSEDSGSIDLKIIIDENKNEKIINMEHNFIDNEDCPQKTIIENLFDAIKKPYTFESIVELSNLLDLNYKY